MSYHLLNDRALLHVTQSQPTRKSNKQLSHQTTLATDYCASKPRTNHYITHTRTFIFSYSTIRNTISYPNILTRAGMPPDLKIARSPSRWWERLCKVPAEQRAVSTSPVFCMARTTAETICGERIRACRDASFLDNWCTIIAALLTTT